MDARSAKFSFILLVELEGTQRIRLDTLAYLAAIWMSLRKNTRALAVQNVSTLPFILHIYRVSNTYSNTPSHVPANEGGGLKNHYPLLSCTRRGRIRFLKNALRDCSIASTSSSDSSPRLVLVLIV